MLNKLRWWIIKKLAQDRPVIMNVSFTSVGGVKSNGQKGLIHKCGIIEK